MSDHPLGVLLADDIEDMRVLLDVAFDRPDFEIVALVADGAEALAAWRAHRDRIDVVALDHRMPEIEGLDVALEIRRDDPLMPIVLFSAEVDDRLADAARAHGIATLHKDEVLDLPDHPSFRNVA